MSLVRQLFHLGVIEAFSGTAKKKESASLMAPYEVAVDPNLITEISDVLQELGVAPTKVVSAVCAQYRGHFLAGAFHNSMFN